MSPIVPIVLTLLLSGHCVIVLMPPVAIVLIPIVETYPVVIVSMALIILNSHYCIVILLSLLCTALDGTSTYCSTHSPSYSLSRVSCLALSI
jgi:hypothetical protein